MEASARTIHARAEFWRVSNRISVPPMVNSPRYETRLPVEDLQHTEATVGWGLTTMGREAHSNSTKVFRKDCWRTLQREFPTPGPGKAIPSATPRSFRRASVKQPESW